MQERDTALLPVVAGATSRGHGPRGKVFPFGTPSQRRERLGYGRVCDPFEQQVQRSKRRPGIHDRVRAVHK